MSSSSEKPPRKIIRLKPDAGSKDAPSEKTAADNDGKPSRYRAPLRHNPLTRSRAKPAEKPEKPAKPERRPRPADTGADTDRPRRAGPPRDRAEYAGDRPRRAAVPREQTTTQESAAPRYDSTQRRQPSRPGPARAPRSETAHEFFAPCPRGLEDEMAQELFELGAEGIAPGSGGVAFTGTMKLAWAVNLWSRLAVRVLWRVTSGHYEDEEHLYKAAYALPWPEWFSHERTIAVHTIANSSPLKSLNFASLKVKDAVCDRFRTDALPRPDVNAREPDVPLLLYLNRDEFTLYIDLSGTPLNRRGFRVAPAQAPINENLAAGMLKLAGWRPDMPLLDPMMGGGTILIEAALMALNIAPGLKRYFAFQNLANFDRVEWARLRKDAEAAMIEPHELPIYGCDIDPAMVRATHANLRAAGLADCVFLDEGDVLELAPPSEHGLIVTNPPYGVRLENEDMTGFYDALGSTLKQRFAGWKAYIISADPELPRNIRLKATRRIPLYNGPLECRLYEYRMVQGEMR